MKRIPIAQTLLVILISLSAVFAQNKELVVGTKPAEPFVVKTADGEWDGIAFDLWKEIARELQYDYSVKEYNLKDLQTALNKGQIDIAVSPLTITAEREESFDFTQPFFSTGLSIAVPAKSSGFISLVEQIFSYDFLEVILLLAFVLFIIGLLLWIFERKKNAEEFGGKFWQGIGSSFWWAAVTMTTVGYGDKTPRSFGGRIVGLIWMFAGIIIISSFTAAIASALTINQLDTDINGLQDLYGERVGTVKASSSGEFLSKYKINYIDYATIDDGFDALVNGQIDAFVYDAPILKYQIKQRGLTGEFKVLPKNLDPIYYAFALPSNSDFREELNRQILKVTSTENWEQILFNYLGE
jgi:ABC-type amino acid transport substrate-binding protein